MTSIPAPMDAGAGAAAPPLALQARAIHKWFGATHALDDVSLTVGPGEVRAIVGENGAGKSTLMKIVSGVIPAGSYDGELSVGGEVCEFGNIREAEAAGIFLVPQELTVVPETSVAENLFLGHEPQNRWGAVDYGALWSATREWIDAFRIGVEPTTPMRRLSAGQRQLVSIARAMSRGVKILILDEPTSSLTDAESELLFAHVAEFHKRGVTTLYISHRLAEVVRLAQHVTVMRDGRVVEELAAESAETMPRRIVRAMVGRDIDELYPSRSCTIGAPLLEVSGLTVEHHRPGLPPTLRGLDLQIHSGEVVGVFGPVGSGSAELAMALFGALPQRTSGQVKMRGEPLRLSSPRDAIDAKLGYLTADRRQTGLVPDMSVASNLSLVVLRRLSAHQLIDRADELELAQEYVRALRIKTADVEQKVVHLSGGNQQKVLAAKWIAADPDILILEEPTRGIDVGARVEIYGLINRLAEAGKGVLIVSSDLPEVIGMSDRVIALHRGRAAGTWSRAEVNQEDVLAAATGGTH
jgi:ABC-type sugar transport system ATPase subunit